MADLVVITPTRGRPRQFAELLEAVHRTTAGRVTVWAGVDEDDDSDYIAAIAGQPYAAALGYEYRCERRSLSAWTNYLAAQVLKSPDRPRYLASLGDDHRPRTKDWDLTLVEAIEAMDGPGFAYGNDLFQGPALPTAWVAAAEAVRALGWMMLPGCAHMYVDTAILALGAAAARITYRPDVVIEHLHPYAGKAQMDDSYRASNTPARFEADRAAFEAWKRDGLATDVEKLRPLVRTGA